MSLLLAAHQPVTQTGPDATIMEACALMVRDRVAAVGVVENERLVGIFEEQDLSLKLVPQRLDPATTKVQDLMTTPCTTITRDRTFADALNLMILRHIRHLPVVDENQKLLGILSLRSMMQWKIDDLDSAVRDVTAYLGADGIGG